MQTFWPVGTVPIKEKKKSKRIFQPAFFIIILRKVCYMHSVYN